MLKVDDDDQGLSVSKSMSLLGAWPELAFVWTEKTAKLQKVTALYIVQYHDNGHDSKKKKKKETNMDI